MDTQSPKTAKKKPDGTGAKARGSRFAAPKPGKVRARVDWDAVERDYRTGKFTNIQLCSKHELAPATLSRKIKENQRIDQTRWQRDLTEVIRQATNTALIAELVNSEIKEGQEKVNLTVKAAVEVNKQVIGSHRIDAQRARESMNEAMSVVMACGRSVVDMREAAVFASAVESLSRTAKNCVEIERKAYQLDATEGKDDRPPKRITLDFIDVVAK